MSGRPARGGRQPARRRLGALRVSPLWVGLLWVGLLPWAGPGCALPAPRAGTRPLPEPAPCSVCGELAAPARGGFRWSDGRASCARCGRDAVVAACAAGGVLEEARRALADALALEVPDAVALALTDRPGLLARAEGLRHPDLCAFTEVREQVAAGGERVLSRTFLVHALAGLPRAALRGVLAHELFHVHQAAAGGLAADADPAFREGAALYAQLRVLERDPEGAPFARVLRGLADPVYGAGLRRFLALVAERGEREALRLGARQGRFPPGSRAR